jgi:hypothetical protein
MGALIADHARPTRLNAVQRIGCLDSPLSEDSAGSPPSTGVITHKDNLITMLVEQSSSPPACLIPASADRIRSAKTPCYAGQCQHSCVCRPARRAYQDGAKSALLRSRDNSRRRSALS